MNIDHEPQSTEKQSESMPGAIAGVALLGFAAMSGIITNTLDRSGIDITDAGYDAAMYSGGIGVAALGISFFVNWVRNK
jgi:hypothetical protein